MKEIETLVSELLTLNVNEHVEYKKDLTYLSWAWACKEALGYDPTFSYEVQMFDGKPYIFDENLGYMVFTTVNMVGQTKSMQLPVMDGANQAQKHVAYTYSTSKAERTVQPATMFDINTAIMRCLTKNLALFGLGLYIYAGEDLPDEPEDPANPLSPEEKAERKAKKKEDFKKQAITNIRR